jgi:hypothetical protein
LGVRLSRPAIFSTNDGRSGVMANVNVGGAEFNDDGTDDDGTGGEGSELDLVDDSALDDEADPDNEADEADDDDDTDCWEEKSPNVESIVDAADDATDIANDHVDIDGSD